MPDVSIYVAVISASAAILGAAVTPVATVVQDARRARRTRHEQHRDEVRRECVELIRAAWDLRTMTQNNHEYRGPETAARLAQVRQRAADTAVRSAAIALLEPRKLSPGAARLAAAAQRVATAEENTRSVAPPDFTELDACLAKFSETAETYFGM